LQEGCFDLGIELEIQGNRTDWKRKVVFCISLKMSRVVYIFNNGFSSHAAMACLYKSKLVPLISSKREYEIVQSIS
jgi:hypothetical protein